MIDYFYSILIFFSTFILFCINALHALFYWLLRVFKIGQRKRIEVGRILVIGNLQVGGTGKTPLVVHAARACIAQGRSVCIVLRGYHSAWENTGGVLRPNEQVDVALCGDEAALLRRLVPEAWIAVGANRELTYRRALQLFRSDSPSMHTMNTEAQSLTFDWAIFDDAFQKRSLVLQNEGQRDLRWLVLSSARVFGKKNKIFREGIWAIRKTDVGVWIKGDSEPWGWSCMAHRLRVRRQLKVAVFGQNGEIKAQETQRKNILLVTTIADASDLKSQLILDHWNILSHVECSDHSTSSERDMQRWVSQANELQCALALTTKDFVKWPQILLNQLHAGYCIFEPEYRFYNVLPEGSSREVDLCQLLN